MLSEATSSEGFGYLDLQDIVKLDLKYSSWVADRVAGTTMSISAEETRDLALFCDFSQPI